MQRLLICVAVLVSVCASPAQAVPTAVPDDPVDLACSFVVRAPAGAASHPGVTCRTYYVDADGDGYGDPATARRSPIPPDGRIETGGDCDDTDPDVHPGAVESFNGVDEDCDGEIDEIVLLLTELMVNPKAVADTAGEYVEVTNVSGDPVDLSGVVVRVGSRDCPVAGLLEAGGRLVVARSADPASNGGFTPSLTCPLTLANSGGVVTIHVPTADLDTVNYTGFDVPDGASLNLNPSVTDPAGNDAREAWCAASSTMPAGDRGTPGAGNDPCA
jgi:hypothetical protein